MQLAHHGVAPPDGRMLDDQSLVAIVASVLAALMVEAVAVVGAVGEAAAAVVVAVAGSSSVTQPMAMSGYPHKADVVSAQQSRGHN